MLSILLLPGPDSSGSLWRPVPETFGYLNELKVNTTCGASNVSFGLPNRNGINSAFLTMAMGAGMTSAITSPLHAEVMQAVLGADVMMGHDPNCAAWIRKYREPVAEGEEGARGARENRRRRRA